MATCLPIVRTKMTMRVVLAIQTIAVLATCHQLALTLNLDQKSTSFAKIMKKPAFEQTSQVSAHLFRPVKSVLPFVCLVRKIV